jgi:transposase
LFKSFTKLIKTMRKLTLTLNEDEKAQLTHLAQKHEKAYVRKRGLALLALAKGEHILSIASVLQVTDQAIREWVHQWNAEGIQGLMKLRKGAPPTKLTPDLVQIGLEAARQKPMFLAEIAAHIRQQRPDAPSFSLARLAVRLKEQGFSFKRTRLSLKKKGSGTF